MFKKVLSFYTRYFAIWVVVFGAVAYVWPGPFLALRSYNKLFFSLTMFGIGAVLALEHFGEKAAMPAAIFVFVCIITASLMAAFWQRNAVEGK